MRNDPLDLSNSIIARLETASKAQNSQPKDTMNNGEVQTRIRELHTLLRRLTSTAYPELESPSDCKRRASVALVIRIKPSYSNWPSNPTKLHDLDAFFSQEWVQNGDPEVLFIKRASRKGDRWTSHIALPGGKRDAGDVDDQAAAIRESVEEVGLDIQEYGIECGNLPQRLVTTHWGKKPLLVLCPYVFLLTTHAVPPLKLQPSEVAATHWVPIWNLQTPQSRTVAFEDVSSRLANQETGVKKWMLSMILGKMTFAAISLLPTESLHSAETPVAELLQDNRLARVTHWDRVKNFGTQMYRSDLFNSYPPLPPEGPLLLWGLTLGVISDFLDLLPPHNALTLWTYPNFTPLDVRLIVWLMTYNFKLRKRAELQSGSEFLSKPSFGYASESLAHAAAKPTPDRIFDSTASNSILGNSVVLVDKPDETGLHGLGTGSPAGEGTRDKKAAVSTMLEGLVNRAATMLLPEIANRARYYDIVRRAVVVALVGRASFAVVLVVLVWRRWVRGRSLGNLTGLFKRPR